MAVPKRKISKRRSKLRRTHYKANAAQLVECPTCHELKRPHTVCPHCGTYKSKEIIKEVE